MPNKQKSPTTNSANLQTSIIDQNSIDQFLTKIKIFKPDSHKGQNGKLLIIGGSKLFHAASQWSLQVASRLADMVFYASIPSNNQLIQQAKQHFKDGIVISRLEIEDYIQEADCVLIGPGMMRHELDLDLHQKNPAHLKNNPPNSKEWQDNTQKITNYLLAKYPNKKWVLDAGALQMANPALLTKSCIVTPHQQELITLIKNSILYLQLKKQHNADKADIKTGSRVVKKTPDSLGKKNINNKLNNHSRQHSSSNPKHNPKQPEKQPDLPKSQTLQQQLLSLHNLWQQATILLKGQTDFVISNNQLWQIQGGNAGLTKGGTGDVLAGLVAGLYSNNQAKISAIAASYINKKTGDKLFQQTGQFYNASQLADAAPAIMWQEIQRAVNIN